MIVFESVYSMSGTIAPIVDIVLLAKKYQALTYIDEVHAVGLYGEKGGGFTELLQIQQGVDIINGTLAKGFGVLGGYIAGDKTIIDAIRSFGSGFIFTTSLPPSICAAANTSIELLQNNLSISKQYHQSIEKFREVLKTHAIFFHPNQTHITIIPIGDEIICKKISDSLLFEYGIYMQPINYPTVKKGAACLRITLTTKHTPTDMVYLAKSLQEVLKKIADEPFVETHKKVLA
jgi:5-aminolevulinate synthase